MRQILRLTATIAALLWFGFASAQTRLIQGTVKDEGGKSVPFMAVQLKGTTIGTYTDTAGKFTLAVDSTAKTLLLSYPGMKDQQIAISDNMQITMKNDAMGLDEVVVTAIGVPLEKKQLGYATQTVTSDELNNSGTSNALNELDGKVAGLQVISSAGDPGAGTYIDLRGPTSLTGNNQPLMVVDGIPIDNSINAYDPQLGFLGGISAGGASGALYGSTQPTNRGLDINPSDIESITVLKGPAATALYGIEAANGALIITTKKGGGGKDQGLGIDFNSSEQWSTVNKLPEMQNTYSQGTWTDANTEVPSSAQYVGPTGGIPYSWGPALSTLTFQGPGTAYDSHGTLAQVPGGPAAIAYNPYDFFQTGVAADNNISFSGGNEKSGFRMSLGNLEQTGIIPTSKYDKNTFNINGQTALSKKLSISAGINYTNSVNDKVQQGSNTSGVMLGLLRTPPTFDNSNGNGSNAVNVKNTYILPNDSERNFAGYGGYDNPYWTVNENPYVETVNRLFGFGQLKYQITDWMTVNWHFGGDAYVQDDKNILAPYSSTNFPNGDAYLIDYINQQYNSDVTLNINRKLTEDLNLNLLLGQNYFDNSSDMRLTQGSGLTLPYFLDMSNATSFNSHESEGIIHRSAWYGQAVLSFKSQLFLTVTGRDETTSTLSANNDVFFYPSADLGWVFTEPLHLSTNKYFSFGKLRLSWAQVGQDAPSQALQTYYSPAAVADGFTSGVSFPFGGLPGFQFSTPTTVMGNPNLLPQKTNSTEVGLDLAFFQNRVSINATYYSEVTHDEILAVPIPFSSGFGFEEGNLGEVTNKGAELTINTTPIKLKNGFQWDLNFNWSKNVNEVVQLAPGVNSLYIGGFNQYDIPGQPADEIYGTDFVRAPGTVYNPSNPNANLVLSSQAGPGYGLPIVGTTNQPLANAQPSWIGGVTTSFTYRTEKIGAFSIAAVMSIREGGYMWDGTYGAMEYFGTAAVTDNRGSAYSVPSGAVWGYVNGAGQTVLTDGKGNTTSSATSVVQGQAAGQDNAIYSQYYYQNVNNTFTGPTSSDIFSASYVRISQLSVTYELPKRVVRRAHFVRMAITLFANNPFLWTSYPGVDPETNLGGPANAQGADYFNNPNTKSYGVRLNLGI